MAEKKKYTVSLKVELRFSVEVEAESFEEAFRVAKEDKVDDLDLNKFEDWVETAPVHATRSDDVEADYGTYPYPDEDDGKKIIVVSS